MEWIGNTILTLDTSVGPYVNLIMIPCLFLNARTDALCSGRAVRVPSVLSV